jgi:hypothetical protein
VAATLVALAVRSDRFANDLVAIVVLVPLLAVGTALMSVSVLALPFGIGLLFRRAWQRTKWRATAATHAGPVEHQMIFENLPVTSLTPETILRLTSRALQAERALQADPQWNLRQFLMGAMVCSGLLAALVSIAVCSPGLRPWSTAHFRIVLAPIVVFMCTLVAIGATKVRRS